jgi:hypothetical protein
MIAGLSLLVLINLCLRIYIAAKSKEIRFNIFKDFIKPLVQDSILLLATQTMVFAVQRVPLIQDVFFALEMIVFATVLVKYYRSIRQELKQLGMEIDAGADAAINSKIDSILGVTPKPIEMIPQVQAETIVEDAPLLDEAEEAFRKRESEE